ncbi:hypothetical protein [Pseudoruegeria sp. SK021]|uniref:hypothetical protein n=1 Tax=Pseudoruegeria sp. SK021 TaxID=1933035 RepID=UPI000A22C866|nr:hypothetical protein [Pseudoruegeria sp. SK021]OSP54441.1 hypothetical protein BV911_12635 [Pseudoruegeria sp. SK021]
MIGALTGLVLWGLPASAAVVENGSFEDTFSQTGSNYGQRFDDLMSGPGSSWDVWSSIAGWTTDSGAGIEIQSNRTLTEVDAYDGNHYVELDSNSNSSMFQDVLLDVGHYVMTFFYGPRTNNSGTNGINYSLTGLFQGSVGGPGDTTARTIGFWSQVSEAFNVQTAGTYRLRFGASGLSDSYGGLIDAISIAPTVAPVPLPLPVVLLASGIVGLIAVRRVSAAGKK